MTPAEFAASITGFATMKPVDQIKRFCWYLAFHEAKATFTATDVTRCFDFAKCQKPSSVSAFFNSLANQQPPYLIRKASGYELSIHGHELFDSVLGQRERTIAVRKVLEELPSKLSIPEESVFLKEALTCFKHGASRAAIVMTWNLAYDHLCNHILATQLVAFNTALSKSFPKATAIANRDDFEDLKESQVLQVATSANIISGSVHKILKEKLDRRNVAAHPSGVVIAAETAEEFILDLVQNAVLKL